MAGPAAWDANETIRRAIEIRDGEIQTRGSCPFRAVRQTYPYPVL